MRSLFSKIFGLFLFVTILIIVIYAIPVNDDKQKIDTIQTQLEEVKDGVHLPTGLKAEANYKLVVANCTGCHSAKLVTQNRMSKNQWKATIKWMQKTQNLWDLGANEDKIISYLVANYPYLETGRRANLTTIDWYELEE